MRLFHLDSERGFRGGERQLLYLTCWLRARGHRSTVVCRRGSPLENEARRLGLDVLNLPFLGEWDPLSAALLRRSMPRGEAVVLHAHTAHTASLAWLASMGGGPARVVHRRVDFRISGGLSARLKYASAGAVLAVSDSVRALLAADGVPVERVKTVRDCIPASPEEARLAGLAEPPGPLSEAGRWGLRERLAGRWGVPAGAPWVGNLAALAPHKDQATLLRAAAAVLAARGDVRFFLVGDGPLRAELESLAGELGLLDRVRFVGRSDAPIDWLRALDVYAHSSWGEGLGSVLLEAAACRLSVAATAAGGVPEVVTDGKTGLLSSPRDPEALARNVLRLIEDPPFARGLAEAAARRLSEFGLERCGRRTLDAYEAALGVA